MDGCPKPLSQETANPPGWVQRSFYELARITSGQVDPRKDPYREMILVAPDHIRTGSGLIDQRFTAEQQSAISGKYLVKKGEIIYSKIRPNLQKLALATEDCLCSADMYPVTAREGVSPVFLKYLMLSAPFTEFATSVSVRSGMPKINREELAHFSARVPESLCEQEAIAEVLSDADALIKGMERLIDKKRLVKQGAMQDLLTAKRRLPGFSGEWVTTTFGQCFQFLRTGSASRSQLGTNLGVGYIHYGDIHGMKSSVLDLSKTKLPEINPRQVATLARVQDGDLVIADASEDVIDVGKSVEVCGITSAEVVAGLHTFLLRGNPEIVADGFKAYIQFLQDVRAGIESIATGSSVFGISKKNLAGLRFRVPPVDEQSAIGELFADMDAEIQALETRLEKARQVKEGMMQNLLTGRIRLV